MTFEELFTKPCLDYTVHKLENYMNIKKNGKEPHF